MERRTADVSINLYWDNRWKRWAVVGRQGQSTFTLTADTTVAADEAAMRLLVIAVRRELEAMFEFDGAI